MICPRKISSQIDDGYSVSLGYYQQGVVQVLIGLVPQPLSRRLDMRVARQFGAAQVGSSKLGGEVALVLQNVLQDNNVGCSGNLFDRRAYLIATFNF
jgi:hypothetical protein